MLYSNLPVNYTMLYAQHQQTIQQQKIMNKVSFTSQLKNIEPSNVWALFEEISNIYRPSSEVNDPSSIEGQKKISEWMITKLVESGFTIHPTDSKLGKYNVIATRNVDRAKKNAVILQAHLDMVYVPANIDHKIQRKLIIDKDWIHADNRTLGADNGIGLAFAIAIAQDPQFKNLPLEIIATTDEEIGCYGAMELNQNHFMGKYLINLDSEEFGKITKGCAAMDRFEEKTEVLMLPISSDNYKKLRIKINNASGGHSGMDIGKGRINPIREMLSILNNTVETRLISLKGGDKFNSIPTDAEATLLIPNDTSEFTLSKIENTLSKIKNKHLYTDPGLEYVIELSNENVPNNTLVIDRSFQDKLFSIVGAELWSGEKSKYENGDTRTSQNLSIVNLDEGQFFLSISMRSSDETEKKDLFDETTRLLSKLFERKINTYNNEKSSIWEPKNNSLLTQKAFEALKETGVDNPTVSVIHGGLENAEFSQIQPELDQISIGPDITNPHSAKEAISISSVQKFYTFLINLLNKLAQDAGKR